MGLTASSKNNYPKFMAKSRGSDWTEVEVRAVVDSYFRMLRRELAGETLNKADENRKLQRLIRRTKGSIEFKHQNVSAVIIEAKGIPIDGYKPRRNVQDRLRSVVLELFETDSELRQLMLHSVEATPDSTIPDSGPTDFLLRSNAPAIDPLDNRHVRPRKGRFVDYQRLEAQRRDLGLAGELAVLAFEHRSLENSGHHKLAERVEHVSATQGDGTGFDILSFEPSGKEKFIEVKTTRSIKQLPFVVTRNEVEFSIEAADQFYLYRVFQYGKPSRGFYSLQGSLERSARLKPIVFEGRPA